MNKYKIVASFKGGKFKQVALANTKQDAILKMEAMRKEYTEIMHIRGTKPNQLTDEHVKRMQKINKICKAIVQQVNYNLNN